MDNEFIIHWFTLCTNMMISHESRKEDAIVVTRYETYPSSYVKCPLIVCKYFSKI